MTDISGSPIKTYAKKRPLKRIAEELDISIDKLRRILKVLKKDGAEGLT